ncbi:MAG TPA: PAS domain-containing protein, partial [Myxococcota bacterium]|nr:PAS domain-containing protein [Myxococcota bacterium]
MVPFRNPKRFLAELDAATTARIIASAADVALILDKGVIKDVAIGNEELSKEGYDRSWRGKPWIDTVTVESRSKIEDLLQDPSPKKPRWRHVNHPAVDGLDVPVQYTTVRADGPDRIVALGRDLRSVSRLQQRLVEAHQSLERDYSRLRAAEARYELLFQSVAQPILIVDPAGLRIEEANPAAAELWGVSADSLVGSSLEENVSRKSQRSLASAVAEAASVGQSSPIRIDA